MFLLPPGQRRHAPGADQPPSWKALGADSLRVAAIDTGKRRCARQGALCGGHPIFSTFALLPCNPMLTPDRPLWPNNGHETQLGRELLADRLDASIILGVFPGVSDAEAYHDAA